MKGRFLLLLAAAAVVGCAGQETTTQVEPTKGGNREMPAATPATGAKAPGGNPAEAPPGELQGR